MVPETSRRGGEHCRHSTAGVGEPRRTIRFLLMAAVPVPMATMCFIAWIIALTGEVKAVAIAPLVCFGYVYMGMQSLLWALIMSTLDHRSRMLRGVVGCALGGMCGASFCLLGLGALPWLPLGFAAGVLTTVVIDRVFPTVPAAG